MELGVVAAVLGAAFLHAFWNFMVRRADDKALGMASVMIGHVPLAVLALLWMGLPPLASAPYVLMSAVLHVGDSVFLLHAYRFGKLSEIYPIARGGIAYFDHPGYGDIFARQSDPVSDAGGVDDFNRDSGLWICAIS